MSCSIFPVRSGHQETSDEQHRQQGRFSDRSHPVSSLAPVVRWPGRHAGDGRGRGRRPAPRLQAQAQFLRPGRGHRAARRAATHPLRASRGAQRGRHQHEGPHLLFGRQHLHAGPVLARLEGELLQVHQRNPQRHRGLQPQQRAEVHRRAQRRLRRRRLRAGAGLRRDPADRRSLVLGRVARSAAAGRAARYRGPDPRHRQAPRAPRSRRHLLHPGRRRARPARQGLAPGR